MFTRRGAALRGLAIGGLALAAAAQAGAAFAQTQPAAAAAPQALDGPALAEQLVAAMGGREAWARARGLTITATHFEAEYAESYENVMHVAFERPRMRFEGRNAWMNRTRAVDGAGGWRVSEVAPLGPLRPETLQGDLAWWTAHPYRTVWRLARRDPGLTARRGADGRLELVNADGSQLIWYALNKAGEPYAYGVGTSAMGTILGPLAPAEGGVRLPVWSSRMDGTFRTLNQKGRLHPTEPQVDYAKP